MSIAVIITFQAQPERRAAFVDLLDRVKRDLPTVEGCEGLAVFNHVEQPEVFTLVETWASKALHEAHIRRVVASGQWDVIASHLATDPVSGYFQAL